MSGTNDPIVRDSRRNLLPWIAFIGLAVATAIALFLILNARSDISTVKETVVQSGSPCIDANGIKPGIEPSSGCRRVYRLLIELCAQDPRFCRLSERKAVRSTQERSVDRVFKGRTSGGGGSSGADPNSPKPRDPDSDSRPKTPNPSNPAPTDPSPTPNNQAPLQGDTGAQGPTGPVGPAGPAVPTPEPEEPRSIIEVPPVIKTPKPVCDLTDPLAPIVGLPGC